MTATNDKQQAGTSLKSCPFCGGNPKLIDARPHQAPAFYVLCKGKLGDDPCNAQVWPSDTPEKAIELWNTRSIAPEETSMRSAEVWDKELLQRISGGMTDAIDFIRAIQNDALASRPSEGTSEDENMSEATEITKEIQNVIDDGLFPFQAVRLLIFESFTRLMSRPNPKEIPITYPPEWAWSYAYKIGEKHPYCMTSPIQAKIADAAWYGFQLAPNAGIPEGLSLARAQASRLQYRIDACLERNDGNEQKAIESSGIGISYLFAKELVHALSEVSGPQPPATTGEP